MRIVELKKRFSLILVLILSVIPLLDLLHSGLPVTHDGQDHVARIANFYQSISEGNIIPRWAGNLNWGFGHPILMFLYPFPSYLGSLFHYFGFSFIDSVKLVFAVSYIVSGVAMYYWGKNALGEKAGIVAAALYMYAPYRFVDLYVRGAIGEHVAFTFVPMILYLLLKSSQNHKEKRFSYFFLLTISITGLLLSHNALALMFIPILFAYSMFLIYTSKEKKYLASIYITSGALGFGLSSFFIIPAFFEGKYTLRDIVTSHGEYRSGFVNLKDFVVPQWSYGGSQLLSKQIGMVHLFLAGISLLLFNTFKKNKKSFIFYMCLFSISLSIFLMLSFSDVIWQKISLLQKFQFPWRLLSPVVLCTSILGALTVAVFEKKKYTTYLVFLLCFFLVIVNFKYFHPRAYLSKNDSFFTGIYNGTTDTGESSPRWSVRFMEHKPSTKAEFIDGEGRIKVVKRTSTYREYEIFSKTKTSRVLENTLYFPNWEVSVNGKKTLIEFQDKSYRGLMTYFIAQGKNKVIISFKDTKLRTISNSISIASFILIVLFYFYFQYINHKKHA